MVRGDVQGRLGGIVSKRIWRVLACPIRMLRIGSMKTKNQRELAGKWLLKRCVCDIISGMVV